MKRIFLVLTGLLLTIIQAYGQNIGYSGMVKVGKSKYLVVIDKKHDENGARAVIVDIDKKGFSVDKLDVKDWKHKDGRANDLESVCAVPGREDEYLLVESGYWNKKFGRIFHVSLKEEKIKVLDVYKLPKVSPAAEDNEDGDNFEGVECLAHENNLYILLGERGGTARYNNGLIRIGVLREKADKVDWDSYSDYVFDAKLPRSVTKPAEMRTISDLFLKPDGRLYASAAIDKENIGPFRSFVYEVGSVSFKGGKLQIERSKNKEILYIIEGFKVEALSSAPEFINNTEFSIGTEDEHLGGEWRTLWAK